MIKIAANTSSIFRGLNASRFSSNVPKNTHTLAHENAKHVTMAVATSPSTKLETAISPTQSPASSSAPSKEKDGPTEWKVLDSKNHGLSKRMIEYPTSFVLKRLQKDGHETYLVGGCVRDLLLRRIPKDFDILTTANFPQIKKQFHRCIVVGRRFPICHVYIGKEVVEVSSFSTPGGKGNKDFGSSTSRSQDYNDRDYVRWQNCMKRDFTINGLMYDTRDNIIYDYVGAIEDLKMGKVRTVIPAHVSFAEDNARILRAVRIAARLQFRFSRDTARAIQDCSLFIRNIDKSRIMMEMNYMLAYGSAEPTVRLLWRFGLLEILLPIQASYFVSQGFKRRDNHSNLLLVLFKKLDSLLSPQHPCHNTLWVGLLAFHLALVYKPQDGLVVTSFALSIRNGGNIKKAVNKARKICQHANAFHPEIADSPENLPDEAVIERVINLADTVNSSLIAMMDKDTVSQAMSKYPQAPFSDLVFITQQTYSKVVNIFGLTSHPPASNGKSKKGDQINYEALLMGETEEMRFAFAKIIIEALYLTH
eukprot:TRINITY_DN6480_c0_g1_i1.p1 TRINITY_DN6480_c0_g1~~TRINITY_DN6480_c0_g1_i1.p1  ORF type:complete len:534 (+),score=83.90 TRINITY_DN6480_c0_g1_i1:162-1763(+)